MEKTKTPKIPHSFILSHFDIVNSLTLLLERSILSNDVKKHCNTAFKVIGIIYADKAYNTGTYLLSRKEFDEFFELFPKPLFNKRELIPVEMVIENIKECIRTNKKIGYSSKY